MSTLTITLVDEDAGRKAEVRYSLTAAETERIVWAIDHCYACNGDWDAIFARIAAKLVAVVVDHTHQYELGNRPNPIVPQSE